MMRAEDDGFTRMFLTVQLIWQQVSSEMRLCYSPLIFLPLGGGGGGGGDTQKKFYMGRSNTNPFIYH